MGKHLKNSLDYILNPKKTRMGTLIGGNHVLPDSGYAFQQMLETKRVNEERYGNKKTQGRQGYHFVLSFAPKDCVTPEIALEITEKFVKKYIPGYESVYAVHDNTENVHSHIVFNSVDMIGGRKFHIKNTEWRKNLQPIVNQLCEEYGLSTIEIPDMNKKTKEPDLEKKVSADTKKKSTVTRKKEGYGLVMDEIWESLHLAKSRQEFDREMRKRGYVINRKTKNGEDRVHTSVLAPGRKKKIRLNEEQEKFLKVLPEYCKTSNKRIKTEKNKYEVTKISITNSMLSAVGQGWMDRIDGIKTDASEADKNEKEKFEGFNLGEGTETKSAFIKAGRKNIIHTSKLQKKSITILSISQRYILYDYKKRKYGRYYKEYIKFNQIQRKVKYLYKNNIKTLEQLENRKEKLIDVREKLKMQKQEIFQERRRYAKLFRLYEELKKLQVPVMLYREGDRSFAEKYLQMKKIMGQIKQSGSSVEWVKEKYEEYKQQLSSIGKIEHMLEKEVALCEEIRQENTNDRKQEEVIKNNKIQKTKKEKKKVR